MGQIDVKTSEYFENNEIFADMINGYYFNGEQVIHPEELKEANKELSYTHAKGKVIVRDNVKKYYRNTLLCIYVLEHQSSIDYHMVIRNMLSEAMEYHRQWKERKRHHRQEKDLHTTHEFISGMRKTEKFIPVLSLVVYYGQKKWDAAYSLKEVLDTEAIPKMLETYISDYRIHVFDYHNYEQFEMFKSELNQAFSFKKYSQSKEDILKLIAENKEAYYNISKETCEFIASITNSKELLKLQEMKEKEMGGIDVCKALEDLRMEGYEEGIEQGIEQGIKQVVCNMLNRNMSVDDICGLTECTPEFVEKVRTSC